jgi:hypothetical protein
MKNLNKIFLLFLLIIFLIGLYLYTFDLFFKKSCSRESFDPTSENKDCPNLLINKGHVILLYNTSQPEEDGKNPIPFKNLDEYIHYLETQRKNGINCPVLYLQQENDAQGKDVYRIRPSPFDQQGGNPPIQLTRSQFNHQDIQKGPPPTIVTNNPFINDPNKPIPVIDASRENPPYNTNNYAGFDPTNQYVGVYTNIDAIHDSTRVSQLSDNPMDENWAGVLYTENSVQSGKYDDNNVVKPTYFNTTNTVSYSNIVPNPTGLGAPDNYRV